MPNYNKNKRKQKLETKTKALEDEIEFDVELPESSDEESSEDTDESEQCSVEEGQEELVGFEVELYEIKQEKPNDGKFISPKRGRKRPDYDSTSKALVTKIKRKRKQVEVHAETESSDDMEENVITERDEGGFNLYKEAYTEMDDEEAVYAWIALAPREHSLWRRKATYLKEQTNLQGQKTYQARNWNLSERTRSIAYPSANMESDDLDLPTLFPDAATEVKKLLARFAEKLSELNVVRQIFGTGFLERVKNFTKLTELQKDFFTQVYYNDTVTVDTSYLVDRFVPIRNSIFKQRLKSPAMKFTSNVEKLLEREGYSDIDDFVYVKTADSTDIKIARIKEKYMNGKVILGCLFITPNSIELEHICPIYRNNVIMVNDGNEFKFKSQDIVGKCVVLSFSDYITARPTDIPEQDVYFCTHIKTCKRLLRPLVIDELMNVIENYRGEVYYFKFNDTEELVHDNQIMWSTNVKDELNNEVEEAQVQVKTELDDDESSVVNNEIVPEVQVKVEEEETVVKVECQDQAELIIPDLTVIDSESSEYVTNKKDNRPLEIILYDDTTNTINLADTEDVLFVVDKSSFSNNLLEDGEVIEID